jgi:hypothetical protein
VRIGLLEAALLRHSQFMSLVHDPFAQLARAVQRFPKPLGAALSNLLGWFSCSLYRDGSTVGPFGSLSSQCQEAVLWRVAEAVLMPPGSSGSQVPPPLILTPNPNSEPQPSTASPEPRTSTPNPQPLSP